ncbi:MAG: hypothetical protein EOO46_16275 [Flavobacterium sp.]|nr:MAG: hypothetical protein EOO46_16275 [Flavobacterium sp.]
MDAFKFLHDLITETDASLVHAIYKFLSWLGFENVLIKDEQASSILEEDLQIEDEIGLIIIETKGIGGTSKDSDCSQISKIKLRRCEERKSFDVSALYIVNHQRYLPPVKRRNPPFTENQIRDAINDKRGLLTTWQLFNLYFDIQNGLITKEDARSQLIKHGLVEFKPKIDQKLEVPKQILKDGQVVILDLNDTKLSVEQILIAEKDGRYFKTKIVSIQIDNISVTEVCNGEAGLKLDTKISKGSILWTEQNGR